MTYLIEKINWVEPYEGVPQFYVRVNLTVWEHRVQKNTTRIFSSRLWKEIQKNMYFSE